jgi:hypothetical protein
MADSATKKLTGPDGTFAGRYGLAFASVAGALLLELLFTTSICLIRLLHLHCPQLRSRFGMAARSPVLWQFCFRR